MARNLTTKYPNSAVQRYQIDRYRGPTGTPENPHDWITRRGWWACRRCSLSFDGGKPDTRRILFTECPCAPDPEELHS